MAQAGGGGGGGAVPPKRVERAAQAAILHSSARCATISSRPNWLIKLYENGLNGILADEMGLGKTLQTISLLGYLKESKGISGPHLIITPKSTLTNWANECARWCPSLRVIRFQGDKAARAKVKAEHFDVEPQFDVCLTTYESVIQEQAPFASSSGVTSSSTRRTGSRTSSPCSRRSFVSSRPTSGC